MQCCFTKFVCRDSQTCMMELRWNDGRPSSIPLPKSSIPMPCLLVAKNPISRHAHLVYTFLATASPKNVAKEPHLREKIAAGCRPLT